MNFEEMTKEQLVEYIKNLNEEQNGKYGLVWDKEKEPEMIVEECDKYIPILEEQKSKDINASGENHILIEGDNFHALTVLNYTHKESIDIIYIDPPYNTGNKDFVYNDKFVDLEDGYRHSKWLNFMKKRIQLSRDLLTEDGVIFISIDDNEQAQLKMLCDDIFGEINYVGCLPRITKKSGKQHSGDISKNHDYVLVYCKNKIDTVFRGIEGETSGFDLEDEYVETRGKYKLNQTLDYNSLWYNPTMDFPIHVDGKTYYAGGSKELHDDRHRGIHNPKDWVWRWSQAKFDFGMKNGFVVIKEGKDRPRIYTKTYLKATIDKKGDEYSIKYISRENNLSSIALTENEYSNDNAKKELDNILKDSTFDFPKPTSLIKALCGIVDKKDYTILDFFAGSGTTGHAILSMNKADGGHRKFILCTNNENNICENVTYKRIKNVISGYGKTEATGGNLKYFKTDFVDNTNNKDQLYYDLTEKCIPMLCMKEDCYNELKGNSEYKIFKNNESTKITAVYFDMFGNKEQEFIDELKNIDGYKIIYKFSLSDYVDESIFKDVKNYKIEAIPYKIVEVYRRLVKISKGDF